MYRRNHLAALLLAREIADLTNERITVFNGDGRTGAKLLAALDFPKNRLRVAGSAIVLSRLSARSQPHKIVLQLDTALFRQVAGDALLCGCRASVEMVPLIGCVCGDMRIRPGDF